MHILALVVGLMKHIAWRSAPILVLSACSGPADTAPAEQDIAALVAEAEPAAKIDLLACQKSKELAGFNCDYTVAQCTDTARTDCAEPESRNSRFVLGEGGWAIAGGAAVDGAGADGAGKTSAKGTAKDAASGGSDSEAKQEPASGPKIPTRAIEGFWTPNPCNEDLRYALYPGGRLRIDLGNQFMEDGSQRRVGIDGTWSLSGDTLTLKAPDSLDISETTVDYFISEEPTNERIKINITESTMTWTFYSEAIKMNRCDGLNIR